MKSKREQMSLKVGGMSCSSCVDSLRNALVNVPGVELEEVELGRAKLGYDPDVTSPDAVRDAITRAGFEPQAI